LKTTSVLPPICLSTACLSACCLPACLPVFLLPARLSAACLPVCLSFFLPACLPVCPLVTSYQRLNAGEIFMIFFVAGLCKTLSRKNEFPENRRISSKAVLGGTYEFPRLIYVLL
jgi:hypothetical protein